MWLGRQRKLSHLQSARRKIWVRAICAEHQSNRQSPRTYNIRNVKIRTNLWFDVWFPCILTFCSPIFALIVTIFIFSDRLVGILMLVYNFCVLGLLVFVAPLFWRFECYVSLIIACCFGVPQTTRTLSRSSLK